MNILRKTWAYIVSLPRLYSIGGAVVIVAAVGIGAHALTRQAEPAAAPAQISHVSLKSVASLSSQAGPLTVIGKAMSVDHATILAETSGQVVSLTKSIGSHVAAGEVIGSFENSSQKAAVQQAQGAYDAAAAAGAGVSLPDAAAAARNAYRSAYTTLDSTLNNDVDEFFGSPSVYGPQLRINSVTGDPAELSRERANITAVMNEWRDSLGGADSADPSALLDNAASTTQSISAFITDLARSANARNSHATDEQLSALTAARTAVDGVLQAVNAAQSAYRSKSVGTTAGTDASVEQALGALNGAKANLEKTVIRSPISGTIVSLPIHQGDFVSSFAQVAEVSNLGALEVDTYVTPDDARTLSVGGAATINEDTQGAIVSIAPALDPTTGKIEVKLGVTGDQSALTDGASVTVSLERSNAPAAAKAPSSITIPIIATKITPQGPIVFTLDAASSTLVAQPITLGTILGDRVTVASGLAADMEIVTDARGLTNGEHVVVDTP